MRICKICVWLVLALFCLNYEVQAKGRSSGGSRSSSRSSSHSNHSHSSSGGGFWRGFRNFFGGTKSSHSSTRSRSHVENDWDYNSGNSHRSRMSTHSSSLGYNSNPSYGDSYVISSSLNNIPEFRSFLDFYIHKNLNVPNDDVSYHNNLNNPVSIPNHIGLMDDNNDINNSFNFNAILERSLIDIRRDILNMVEKSSSAHYVSSTTKPSSDNLVTENTTPTSDILVETVEPKEETTAGTTQQTNINQSTTHSTTTLNSVTSDANTIETPTTTTTASGLIKDDIAGNTLPSILQVLKSSTTESTTTLTSVSTEQIPSETTTTYWVTEETKAATNVPKSTAKYLSNTDSSTTLAGETSLQNDNGLQENVRLVNMICRKVWQSKYNKLGYFIDSVEDICEPDSLIQNDKKSDLNEKSEDYVRSVQMMCRKVMRNEFSDRAYFLNSVDEICAPEALTQDDRKSDFAEQPVKMMCKNVLQSAYNDRHLGAKSTKLVCKSEVTKIRWAKEN